MFDKKSLFFILLLFSFWDYSHARAIIQNSDTPLNKKAGREIKIEEVLRIEDTGDDFYFNYIADVKIAPDNTIFIKGWKQLYQFNADGQYLRDYYKEGQGPGECVYMGNFTFVEANHIIIHGSNPAKILFYDLAGRYKKESRIIKHKGFLNFIHQYNDRFYFHGSSIPVVKGSSAVVDIPQEIVSVSPDGQKTNKLISFLTKEYIIMGKGGGRGMISINDLIAVPFLKKFLIINHTPEYLVKLFDLQQNKVVLEFNRKYSRVTPPPGFKIKGAVIINNKKHTAPTPKYLNDIEKIFVRKDKIWVFTSTKDEKKGVLVDIFDSKGRYVDNFYIKLKGELMTIHFDDLFVLEKDEDETPFIVKYRKFD